MAVMRKVLLCLWLMAGLAGAAESALLRLVMPDAAVIIGINVNQIKSSPISEAVFSGIESSDESLKTLIGATGFDMRRDLLEVVIAGPGGGTKRRGLLLVRGSFDTERFLSLARAVRASVTSYQGIQIVSGGEKEPFALAWLDDSILVGGDQESVRAAIARHRSSSRLYPRLLAKASELSQAFDAWGVSVMPVSELAGGVPDPKLKGALQGDVLKAIEQASGGVKFGTRLQASVELTTRTEKEAAALRDVLQFFAGLALAEAHKTQPAVPLEDVRLTVQGRSVKLSLEISEQQVAQMIQAQRQGRRGEPKSTEVVIYGTEQEASAPAASAGQETRVVTLPGPK
jgi:hypothetical protein